jgi:hypothetical protein
MNNTALSILSFFTESRRGRIIVRSGTRVIDDEASIQLTPSDVMELSDLKGELPRYIRFTAQQVEASDDREVWSPITEATVQIFRFLDPRTILRLSNEVVEDSWENKPGDDVRVIRAQFNPFGLNDSVSSVLSRLPTYRSGGFNSVAYFHIDARDGWLRSFEQNVLPAKAEVLFARPNS